MIAESTCHEEYPPVGSVPWLRRIHDNREYQIIGVTTIIESAILYELLNERRLYDL